MKRLSFLAAPVLLLALAGTGFAAEYEVEMLNKGEAGTMVFEPAFVKAEPGDVIHFVPTDKSHNVESIKEILPEGVETFKSKINDEFSLTVTEPGLYGVKCTPHFAMGMVALIEVGGDLSNLDAIKAIKNPKPAQVRFDAAFAQLAP